MADMLKIVGHWVDSKEFVKHVSEKLDISPRHAHRKIKEAAKKRKILKHKIPNSKIVLYGLAESGPSDDYCYRVMYSDCELDKAFGKKPQIRF